MMDPAELTQYFDTHAAGLLLYARQWLDPDTAEDVVQETFVRLMLCRTRPDNVRAWLYRAARNEAITRWRSGRRRRKREELAARREPVFEDSPGSALDARVAAGALERLDETRREIIVLRIWGELKLAEIAAVTGLPVSSVFHHYQQGLRQVRKEMGMPCKNHND